MGTWVQGIKISPRPLCARTPLPSRLSRRGKLGPSPPEPATSQPNGILPRIGTCPCWHRMSCACTLCPIHSLARSHSLLSRSERQPKAANGLLYVDVRDCGTTGVSTAILSLSPLLLLYSSAPPTAHAATPPCTPGHTETHEPVCPSRPLAVLCQIRSWLWPRTRLESADRVNTFSLSR